MNFRRSALRAMSIRHDKVRFRSRLAAMAAGIAFTVALPGVGARDALAAPDAASAASSTSVVAIVAGTQYTVHAGQSLNDVAIAVTQSHDRAVLARATHALFDANPNAFMNHDPSRMRVGAVLVVPALDASGALAASPAAAVAGASESSAAVPASASTGAPAAAAAASTASAVAQVNAAAASAASAAAQATTPAAPAVSGVASAPAGASESVATGAAAGGVVSTAPVAGSASTAASGAQEWNGSIQAPASAAAGKAPLAATPTAPAAAAALAASHPQVSSLQQLLALKNRVLMELQKHGIGEAPVASGPAPTSAAQPAAAGSAAVVATTPNSQNVATPASNEGGISQRDLSIAAAVGAALVVLLAALRMGRRKREKEAPARAAQAADADLARSERVGDSRESGAAAGQEESDARDQEAARQAAEAAAAERAAAERVAAEQAAAESAAAERAAAEKAAAEQAALERAAAEQAAERAAVEQVEAERAAAERAAAEQAASEHAAAERAAAERAAAEQAAAEQAAAEQAAAEQAALQAAQQPQQDIPEPTAPTAPLASISPSGGSESSSEPPAGAPIHDDTLSSAATVANLAAAAELGADALPLGPLEPITGGTQDEQAHRLQWDDESTESPTVEDATGTPATSHPSPTETPSAAPDTATVEPQPPLSVVAPPATDFASRPVEPRATPTFDQPDSDTPAQAAPSASTRFPRDAVEAFSSLDMPLPPRLEVPSEAVHFTSLSTQPVASPDTTAQQAFGEHDADASVPHVADQIVAGTAGQGAVAGLGAAGFGALKLDFDLELPPSPAQPLPAFTPADLGRIARNKLELASEYIELGDLAGARALINEVIEANDPATRTEARALLSTLAPLS
jgi:pilus assembly protein FimV